MRSRKIEDITYVENKQLYVDLPMDNNISEIILRMYGDYTVGGTNGAVVEDGGQRLLNLLEVVANGQSPILSMTGQQIWHEDTFDYKTPPYVSYPATLLTTATGSFVWQAVINFKVITPYDAMLPAFGFTSLKARIKFGSDTDFDSTGNTTLSNTILEISVKEVPFTGKPRELLNAKRNWRTRRNGLEESFSATGTKDFKLNKGNVLNRFLMLVKDSSGDLTDVGLDNIELLAGTDSLINMPYKTMKNDLKTRYGLESIPTGVLLIELDENHDAKGMVRTKNLNTLKFKLGVIVADTTVEIVPFEIIPR